VRSTKRPTHEQNRRIDDDHCTSPSDCGRRRRSYRCDGGLLLGARGIIRRSLDRPGHVVGAERPVCHRQRLGHRGTRCAQAPAPAASRPLSDFVENVPEGPQYSFYSFATPSGRIQCRFVDGGLACQTGEYPHTVADSALCGFYPGMEQGRAVRFGFFDGAPKQPCATIIQGDGFQSPHTLAYGQSVTATLRSGLTVTCTSARDGLTCTQAGGTGPRGFFLSADTFTIL
jgi:hypothetical protein